MSRSGLPPPARNVKEDKLTEQHTDSELVGYEPCPECNSKDNLARYTDGHGYCFGCKYREHGDSTAQTNSTQPPKHKQPSNLLTGEITSLAKRGITEETCKKWGYKRGKYFENGNQRTVQIAPYANLQGNIIAQKIRFPNKDFKFIGSPKEATLFGMQLWRDTGKHVVITEGELDALSVSQIQGNKWPVMSLKTGAAGAVKDISKYASELEKFDKVILMFDMDDVGQQAAQDAAAVLSAGKAYIAKLPLKDANEMLQANRGAEVMDAIWGAKMWRPAGVVDVASLFEEARKKIEVGLPWPWTSLTEATYGRRRGEIYALGAGVGVGKTEVFKEIIDHVINVDKLPVGAVFLEEPPKHTLQVLAGKSCGKRFHVPNEEWDQELVDEAIKALDGKVYFFDQREAKDYETVRDRIRYMVQGLGIKDIFLDHLTALTAGEEDERRFLDEIMKEFATMALVYDFNLYFISHLSTPKDTPHEEGGRVYEKHFTGSRAIARWSHFMFALEGNKQDKDRITIFRVLKDRYTGDSNGLKFGLKYIRETGRMEECELPAEGEKHGFKDQSLVSDDGEF